MSKRSAICIGMLFLTGCILPLSDMDLKRTVREEEVTGTWYLQPETKQLMSETAIQVASASKYSVEFFSNGTCSFDSVMYGFPSTWNYIRDSCSWQLLHDTTGNSLNRMRKNVLRLKFNNERSFFYLNFREAGKKLQLWNYYGDPDSMDLILYQKKIIK